MQSVRYIDSIADDASGKDSDDYDDAEDLNGSLETRGDEKVQDDERSRNSKSSSRRGKLLAWPPAKVDGPQAEDKSGKQGNKSNHREKRQQSKSGSSVYPMTPEINQDSERRFTFTGGSAAVEFRDVRYDVGLGRKPKTILQNINLTIPEGSIYGLLGPSGCGKTTLLRCVVGCLKPRSGSVRVFGYRPHETGSQIPGPAIGYMPQEISVYEDFTINEFLTYFGKINKMSRNLIVARIDFLLNFLDLPSKGRLIASLSGGQKRRVSLAAALVHSPPLLILDEPTVGVDPLLRQSIWNHLATLAQTEKITVLITTHYIEEARQANVVALMRHGKLLAEASPDELMFQHGNQSLEKVFLKLCVSDSSSTPAPSNLTRSPRKLARCADAIDDIGNSISKMASSASRDNISQRKVVSTITLLANHEADTTGQQGEHPFESLLELRTADCDDEEDKDLNMTIRPAEQQCSTYKNRLSSMKPGSKYEARKVSIAAWCASLMAVIWKNYLAMRRNPPVLIFQFILPAVQVILFCLCIGGDPFDIPLAIVNEEIIPTASRLFLEAIDKRAIRQVSHENLSSAIESVRRGESWAAIHIPVGYTRNLQERLIHPIDITNETLTNGTISVYPDLSNLHLALAMENIFREAFIKFAKETLNALGEDPVVAEMPIRVERAVYGRMERNGYLEFMAPGVVISITYVMATGLTALAFILEKRDGLLERSLISGVTTSQILLGHAAVQVLVMTMQISLVLGVIFFLFKIPSNGPFAWAVSLILLQGCTGMAFGLLVSAICTEETTAVMMLVGTFYTNLILAGIIWPIEAMPQQLRLVSYLQPQTLAIDTLRNILSRGWGMEEWGVQLGFLTTVGWLLVFLLATGVVMRYSS